MELYGQGFQWAMMSGCFAGSASIFAKLVMGSFFTNGCQMLEKSVKLYIPEDVEVACYYIIILLKASCFGMFLLCNALMWISYSKSLQRLSSLSATVINSSSNLFSTALFGWFLLGERLSGTWLIGAAMIITGLVVMNAYASSTDVSPDVKDNKVD